jgi:SecY interacting protein Syd
MYQPVIMQINFVYAVALIMTHAIEHIIDQFVNDYIDQSTANNRGLLTEWDAQWPSPCIDEPALAVADGDIIDWLPHRRGDLGTMANLATALDIVIPQSFEALVGRYYSLDLNALHPRGPVTLLQAWNENDYDRLQKNLIAHVLMKRRLKQPDTLFFALTDEDDFIISLEVQTQHVVLEPVGKPAKEILSESLPAFIAALTPQPQFVTL